MMYILYLSILLSLCLYFFSKKNKKAQDATKPLPPGNTGWPIVGETLQYLSDGRRGHPERFVFDRIAKYSSCIFKTNLMMEETAVFCGAGANKFLFANENKLVQSWWPNSVNKIFPSSSQSSSKKEAIKMREMLPDFFKPEALQRYVGIMDEIARRQFDTHWLENDCVIVYPLSKRYTFWLAAKIFISIEESNEVEKFLASLNTISEGLISIPIDIPGTLFHHAIKASESIRKQLILIIKQRIIDLVERKATPTQDILSHMLTTPDENGTFMKEADIADKILGLLVGGYDTASSACAFVVKYLAEFPDVYQRVYNEQIEIAKSKREGEILNWDDIQSMKYSWNVAREVLRLTPPVQGAFRDVLTDFMYEGFYIPKGWKVYWSTHSTHRNPKHFSEPDKFDPSRFEGSGPAPYTFVPFGGGPRMCPGKEYARLEILVFMHNIVKRYKWKMVYPDEKNIVNPMPIPEKGLPIRLFPHDI